MSTQNEKPIIFSSEMIKAIREGRKTQTRKPMKSQPPEEVSTAMKTFGSWKSISPYGQPGDRLWVREAIVTQYGEGMRYKADGEWLYPESEDERKWVWKRNIASTIPSIHMPRWASRITLEIVDVGVERLQDISLGDISREGIRMNPEGSWTANHYTQFEYLWDSLHTKKPEYQWEADPWVWVISFKTV